MKTYIPKEVPDDVLLSLGYQASEKVPIHYFSEGKPRACHDNVRAYLKGANGGSCQFGWMFSMLGKFILNFHAHAVVRLNSGELFCVTPPEQTGLRNIIFARDDSIEKLIKNNRLPVRSYALVDAPIVQSVAQLNQEPEDCRLNDSSSFLVDLKLLSIKDEFCKYVTCNTAPSDICYCGSQKTYAECCYHCR